LELLLRRRKTARSGLDAKVTTAGGKIAIRYSLLKQARNVADNCARRKAQILESARSPNRLTLRFGVHLASKLGATKSRVFSKGSL
jgi:hypothetical protein